MTVKTIGEVGKTSVDVRNFIQGNGYLPELITIGGVRAVVGLLPRMPGLAVIETF